VSESQKKTKNGQLANLASNPLVTVPILILWAKIVNYAFSTHLQYCWAESGSQCM